MTTPCINLRASEYISAVFLRQNIYQEQSRQKSWLTEEAFNCVPAGSFALWIMSPLVIIYKNSPYKMSTAPNILSYQTLKLSFVAQMKKPFSFQEKLKAGKRD